MANTKIPSELIDGTLGVAGISSSADATAITITSDENVGIGTTSPTVPLHISSTGHTQYKQHRQSSSVGTGQEMKFAFNTADGTEEVYGSIYTDIKANTNGAESGNIALRVADAGSLSYVIHGAGGGDTKLYADGATIMTLKSTGYVGISSTAPSRALEINDTANVDGEQLVLKGDASYGGTMLFRRGDSYTWRVGVGGGSSTNSTIPQSYYGIEYGNALAFTIAHTTGRVGIGEDNPSNPLHIVAPSTHQYPFRSANGQGYYYHGHGNSSYHHNVQSGASTGFYFNTAAYANGGFHTYSDERLKENITNIDSALDKVAVMNGVTFDWKDKELRGNGKQFGVIAQDMLKVDKELPDLVEDAEATQEEIDNKELNTQYYSMDYSRLTPYFIEAIKELKTKLEAAEARITELEG